MQDALAAAGVPALGRSRSTGSNAPGKTESETGSEEGRNRSLSAPPPPGSPGGFSSPEEVEAGSDEDEQGKAHQPSRQHLSASSYSRPESLPPAPVSSSRRSKGGVGSGLLSALSHSIHGIMDVDPEAARRSNISKTKDHISQVSIRIQLLNSHYS